MCTAGERYVAEEIQAKFPVSWIQRVYIGPICLFGKVYHDFIWAIFDNVQIRVVRAVLYSHVRRIIASC